MQKALQQMNVQLTQVVSDITGVTGLTILRALTAGWPARPPATGGLAPTRGEEDGGRDCQGVDR